MEKLFELLFQHGGLVQLVVFIVPGFVAWRTYQWRCPRGEQKVADALAGMLTFSVLTTVLWYKIEWPAWPKSGWSVLALCFEIFFTPIGIALVYEQVVRYFAKMNWITSPHPRAWDFIFNSLAYRKSGIGKDGLFLVVTLKNGDKIGGSLSDPACASLWPYDRDMLLGPAWELENGKPVRFVAGSIGVYIDASSIDVIEVFDSKYVVNSALTTTGGMRD